MNIQLYISKKNFDVQKAERFFKERRIKVQVMAKGVGLEGLLDKDDKKVAEHPASYCGLESYLRDYIIENPWLLKSPIVRNGSKCTIGYQPDVWEQWVREG